jgi:hypothetical protein
VTSKNSAADFGMETEAVQGMLYSLYTLLPVIARNCSATVAEGEKSTVRESASQVKKDGPESRVVIQNHVNRGTEKDEGKPDDKHDLAERLPQQDDPDENSEQCEQIHPAQHFLR